MTKERGGVNLSFAHSDFVIFTAKITLDKVYEYIIITASR